MGRRQSDLGDRHVQPQTGRNKVHGGPAGAVAELAGHVAEPGAPLACPSVCHAARAGAGGARTAPLFAVETRLDRERLGQARGGLPANGLEEPWAQRHAPGQGVAGGGVKERADGFLGLAGAESIEDLCQQWGGQFAHGGLTAAGRACQARGSDR
jgi:hypothetical protein